jgi:H+/Cl- antiporter ClcA
VLGFGYAFSIIVCLAECLHKRFSKWWQADNRTYLHFSARRIWYVLTYRVLLLQVLCVC